MLYGPYRYFFVRPGGGGDSTDKCTIKLLYMALKKGEFKLIIPVDRLSSQGIVTYHGFRNGSTEGHKVLGSIHPGPLTWLSFLSPRQKHVPLPSWYQLFSYNLLTSFPQAGAIRFYAQFMKTKVTTIKVCIPIARKYNTCTLDRPNKPQKGSGNQQQVRELSAS